MKKKVNAVASVFNALQSIRGSGTMKNMRYEDVNMSGEQKPGKKKMRNLMAAGVALACLGTSSPAVANFYSDATLKLGVSGLYNHRLAARQAIVGLRQLGGHISLDISGPSKGIGFSPFLDIYHRVQTDASATRPYNDSATNVIGGLNFIFAGPLKHKAANLYFGIGGGVARFKVVEEVNVPVPTTYYRTRMMANALVGLNVKMGRAVSLFVEPHYVWTTKMLNGLSVHTGLAFPLGRAAQTTAPPMRPMPPVYTPAATPPVYTPATPKAPEPVKVEEVKVSSAEALATMQEMVYFQHDRSDLSPEAKAVLNDKVPVFRANSSMRIVIAGFASQPGTEAYNMALGLRRAEAARAYLISQGVDPTRIEIATKGEGQLAVEGAGEVVDAQNRRGQFRLLVVDQFLVAPK